MRCPTIGLLAMLAFGMLLVPLAADAQPAGKVYQIGYLSGTSPSAAAQNLELFRQGLREFGHVEGHNIAIEFRFAEGRLERLPDLAADLVGREVDVIIATGDPHTGAGVVNLLHAQGITDRLPRGADAHEFILQRQVTGLQLHRAVAGGDIPPQFFSAAGERRPFDVIAAGSVRKELLA